MREGVLPLNIVISVFYLVLAALVVYVLKKASSQSGVRPIGVGEGEEGWRESVGERVGRLVGISWIKKYTVVGGLLNKDKKYLLKEFLFVGAYAATCLQINHVILWPVTFSLFLLPLHFFIYDILLTKFRLPKVSEAHPPAKTRVNAIRNQGESQIEIESVNIDAIPAVSAEPLRSGEEGKAKVEKRGERGIVEVVLSCCIGLSSVLLLFKTVMALTNSISNSGQLNITSVLIILCMDQLAVRPAVGLLFVASIKLVQHYSAFPILDNLLVSALCQEELREAIDQYMKEKRRKQQEMTASPPRKKLESPSRVPKAALPSGDQPTYLNLINLQPTRRKTEQEQEEEEGSQVEQIYLTTLQQQMFGRQGRQGREEEGGGSTKRRTAKENKEHSYLSAVQKFTIQQQISEDQDMRQDPLQECHLNRINPFNYQLSPVNYTKRRAIPTRKKHKRVLNLTGSSPYLEYLPNMLKNVDKFKTHKDTTRVL